MKSLLKLFVTTVMVLCNFNPIISFAETKPAMDNSIQNSITLFSNNEFTKYEIETKDHEFSAIFLNNGLSVIINNKEYSTDDFGKADALAKQNSSYILDELSKMNSVDNYTDYDSMHVSIATHPLVDPHLRCTKTDCKQNPNIPPTTNYSSSGRYCGTAGNVTTKIATIASATIAIAAACFNGNQAKAKAVLTNLAAGAALATLIGTTVDSYYEYTHYSHNICNYAVKETRVIYSGIRDGKFVTDDYTYYFYTSRW